MFYEPDETHCAFCDHTYDNADAASRRRHRVIHRRYESLLRRGETPPRGYSARERLKDEGRAVMRAAGGTEERWRGIHMLLEGWFDREIAALLRRDEWQNRPTFEEWICCFNLEGEFPSDAPVLRRRYPAATRWWRKPRIYFLDE